MSLPHLTEQVFVLTVSLAALLMTIQVVVCFPLTLAYALWKRATLQSLSSNPFSRRVSVLVPAYNEEKTLRACVESLLASRYENLEIIVIDDGSCDDTEHSIDGLVDSIKVCYIRQPNSGKATALNRGAAVASGEVLLFTDADSIFLPDTVGNMVRWFADSTIDAVCGNDTPLNTRTSLQKVLAVTSHIGTGFVRRALSVVKKRTGLHEDTIREFTITNRGLALGAPLKRFHGVLRGVPVYVGETLPADERNA